jgi:uncharacterized paraquat-inducible protein A
MDLLELALSVERQRGVKVCFNEVLDQAFRPRTPGGKPDCTAGELLVAINAASPCCLRCDYDLRGHGESGVCPECGRPFTRERRPLPWEELQEILAGVAGCKLERVQPESLLLRDLRLT